MKMCNKISTLQKKIDNNNICVINTNIYENNMEQSQPIKKIEFTVFSNEEIKKICNGTIKMDLYDKSEQTKRFKIITIEK
jgi:hypothetical protein